MQRLLGVLIAICLTIPLAVPVLGSAGGTVQPGELASTAAVLIDADTGQVLYEKNPDKRLYPASTTKIMTGLLVTELCDPAEVVTAAASAIDPIPRDTSHIALDYDEQLSVRDALYAVMLPSANDVSNALAEHAAGSQEAFVALMNERAQELGAVNTHFANAHGLHASDHYTTARDLALITRAAVQGGDLLQYMGTDHYDIGATNKKDDVRQLHNQHYMLVSGQWVYNSDVIGGKVGFTNEARYTMSTVARRGDRTLIVTVLESEYEERFEDTELLLNYGFEQFDALSVGADELTGGLDDLTAPGDLSLLVPRPLGRDALLIDVDPVSLTATLRLATGSVPGLPDKLMEIALERLIPETGVPVSASMTLDEPVKGFSLAALARGALRVLLWTLVVILALTVLVLIRHAYVVRKRRKRRQARMQRLRQQARRSPQ